MLSTLNLTPLSQLLLIAYLIINILAFIIMLNDKMKSRQVGTERIPEGKLFFLAAVFGALGVYAGMFVFRHKTRKWYFLLGIPVLIVQNVVLIYFLSIFISV
ncbi:DUF1294 domain-containing protein [Patescibacteria group bacterium]|nr:DUF1294 domain-containing protein [Patescibacteria group bacterium]